MNTFLPPDEAICIGKTNNLISCPSNISNLIVSHKCIFWQEYSCNNKLPIYTSMIVLHYNPYIYPILPISMSGCSWSSCSWTAGAESMSSLSESCNKLMVKCEKHVFIIFLITNINVHLGLSIVIIIPYNIHWKSVRPNVIVWAWTSRKQSCWNWTLSVIFSVYETIIFWVTELEHCYELTRNVYIVWIILYWNNHDTKDMNYWIRTQICR